MDVLEQSKNTPMCSDGETPGPGLRNTYLDKTLPILISGFLRKNLFKVDGANKFSPSVSGFTVLTTGTGE